MDAPKLQITDFGIEKFKNVRDVVLGELRVGRALCRSTLSMILIDVLSRFHPLLSRPLPPPRSSFSCFLPLAPMNSSQDLHSSDPPPPVVARVSYAYTFCLCLLPHATIPLPLIGFRNRTRLPFLFATPTC